MMAIYTPRQVPSRSQKKGGGASRIGKLIGILLRRNKKAPPPQPQPLVTGAQRTWKLKQFSKITMMIMGCGAVLLVILWLSFQMMIRSDIFRLTDIRISGTRTMTERQILDLVGLQVGGSLLRFNKKAAEERIAAHPWVEQVRIKTLWPSAIEIAVREYQPFALVNLEEHKEKRLRYINKEGRVFAEVVHGQELDFPVITGVFLQKDVVSNGFVKGGLADAACSLLLLAGKGNAILPIQSISEVHIDQQKGLIVYLVDRPFPVYFGKDRLQTKFFRLVKVLEQLYAKKQVDAVKEIRMDYSDDKILVTGAKIDG
jgi:cell division protein FtsQ